MAGLVIVRGVFDKELENYGVETMIPFAVHDPHYTIEKLPQGDEPGAAKAGRFLHSQSGADDYCYLVTGRVSPGIVLKKNQIVHLRHLTATIENLSGFRLVERIDPDKVPKDPPLTDDGNIPFYVVGSDGIVYEKPVKQTSLVEGVEHHELLLQFGEPGVYDVWSDGMETIQFYGTGPRINFWPRSARRTNRRAGERRLRR